MVQRTKPLLVDQQGQPAAARIQLVFDGLHPRFRTHFPTIQDDAAIAFVFESAAAKVIRHEHLNGDAASLHGLAWTALKRQALSWLRSKRAQTEARTLGSADGLEYLNRLAAVDFSAEQIERQVLCRQILERLPERDAKLLMLQQAGFSVREIAEHFGESTSAVATRLTRLKQTLRKSLGMRPR